MSSDPFVPTDVPDEWRSLADGLGGGAVVFVLGPSDVGKTTLCLYLAHRCLAHGLAVGILDTDVGQSAIGPPATIGVRVYQNSLAETSDPPDALYFVGVTNPSASIAEMITGSRRLADVARSRGADVLLVDTTGLVDGRAGSFLKCGKIESLRPDVVVAMEAGPDAERLRHITRRFEARADIRVVRFTRPDEARAVNRARRRRHRADGFRLFLSGATEFRMSLDDVAVFGPSLEEAVESPSEIADTLIGFLDGRGLTRGIGVLRALDLAGGTMNVAAARDIADQACAVQLSDHRSEELREAVAGAIEAADSCPEAAADPPGTGP